VALKEKFQSAEEKSREKWRENNEKLKQTLAYHVWKEKKLVWSLIPFESSSLKYKD